VLGDFSIDLLSVWLIRNPRDGQLPRARGDWRQFGDDPRAKPDWALVGAILWELESNPNFSNCAELTEVRRLYDAGEIDAAFNLLGGVLPVARSIPPTV
jgi:hypothetical protein